MKKISLPIPDDDPVYFYNGFRIMKGDSDKWGIICVQSGETIIDFAFDGIWWEKKYDLIRFCKDGKYALCHFDNGKFINFLF